MHWGRSSCLLLHRFGVRIYVQLMLNVVGIYSWHFVWVPGEHIYVTCEKIYKFCSIGRDQFPTDLKILLWVRRESHRFQLLAGFIYFVALLMGTKVDLALKILCKFQMGQLQDQEPRRSKKQCKDWCNPLGMKLAKA